VFLTVQLMALTTSILKSTTPWMCSSGQIFTQIYHRVLDSRLCREEEWTCIPNTTSTTQIVAPLRSERPKSTGFHTTRVKALIADVTERTGMLTTSRQMMEVALIADPWAMIVGNVDTQGLNGNALSVEVKRIWFLQTGQNACLRLEDAKFY